MKRLLLVAVLILGFMFMSGCTTEFYKHDTIYKSNDHMTFSWWGYKTPTDEDLKMSESEGWWGDGIFYIPAE